jgi:predicted heme/steroid binding protein
MTLRVFTGKELSRYNGKNGTPILIAFEGKVYDVSSSFLWQNGKHQVVHASGLDLTGELSQAPHGADLLEKFQIVGVLIQESG